jgi:hypothetical protein
MNRLQRLSGQMGLSPVNFRKVMTACVQSVAMSGAELWRKGDQLTVPLDGQRICGYSSISKLGRLWGAFQTTNQGFLSLESGIRGASTQLDNRR